MCSEQLRKQRAIEAATARSSTKGALIRRKSDGNPTLDDSSDSDDMESVVDVQALPPSTLSRMACGSCRRKDSRMWWKAPKGLELSSAYLCEGCSMTWRKYAEVKTLRPDDNSKTRLPEKRDGTPLSGTVSKRFKVRCCVPGS